jgi:hypothetical protein
MGKEATEEDKERESGLMFWGDVVSHGRGSHGRAVKVK